MRKFKNLVIGGLQSKIFNLILITIILLSIGFTIISQHQANVLTKLAAQQSDRQQASIQGITGQVMDAVIEQSMSESTEMAAYISNELFHDLGKRVEMIGDYAEKLLSDPEAYPRITVEEPDPARNGEVVTQLIGADGVDITEAELNDRIGLAGNLAALMDTLFGMDEATNSCFIALPDGVFLVSDDRAATKFDEYGQRISYDPRTRPWYIQAVEKGGLIFTDVEIDAFTGDIGIVCAEPVYVDGQLAAVVGSDLFLTSMNDAVIASNTNGRFICVVNQNGHVVFSPRETGDLMVSPAAEAADLRQAENEGLASLVTDAAVGTTGLRVVKIDGEDHYAIGSPIGTVGWSIISACSVASANQPSAMLSAAYTQIQEETTADYLTQTGQSRRSATILMFVIIALMIVGAIVLGKRIVRPLNTITKRISELKEGNLEFKMEDTYRTGDEIEELAQSFATLSHKTVEYIEQVKTVTAEKERIGAELSLATSIQAAMLPHIFPAFPDRPDFDIFASMDPAKEVGGDFYDYFLVDEDHLCMVIADVSGKGVPAALFMMASKIIIQSVAMMGLSPAEILTKTNEAICSNNDAQMFVTVWLGILELSTGKLTCSNAGHEYPVLKRPDGNYELYRDKHGFVIGGMEGVRYKQYELQLEPGCKLFVYTDGVPEATDAQSELFGTERMVDALNKEPESAPFDTLKNVKRAVDGFVKDAQQFDDLTMLCMEYKGKMTKGGDAQ